MATYLSFLFHGYCAWGQIGQALVSLTKEPFKKLRISVNRKPAQWSITCLLPYFQCSLFCKDSLTAIMKSISGELPPSI